MSPFPSSLGLEAPSCLPQSQCSFDYFSSLLFILRAIDRNSLALTSRTITPFKMSNDLTAKIISSYGNRDRHSSGGGHGGLDVNSAAAGWDSSRPGSIYTSSRQSAATLPRAAKRKFKSYRLRGEYEKPWLADPAMKKTRWNNWIVIAWCLVGLAGAGLICFMGIRQYQTGPFCLVFEDDFKTLDTSVWTHMVTVCLRPCCSLSNNTILTWLP